MDTYVYINIYIYIYIKPRCWDSDKAGLVPVLAPGWPPQKFKDFPILYKPLKIKFWDLGSITIFFAVKFREDWSNRDLCSSLVAHFQAFSLFFLIFGGGTPSQDYEKPILLLGGGTPP